MISDAALREFKELWLQECGMEISDKEAVSIASTLLTMMDALYRPIKQEWLYEYEKKYGNDTKPTKPPVGSKEAGQKDPTVH